MGVADLEPLRAAIRARWPGRETLLLEETGSTNDVAKEHARRGGPAGLVVVADRQSAGRGRAGRSWHSPAGAGLYLTTLLPGTAGAITRVPLVCAVALHRAIAPHAPEVGIKWPNDLLAPDGRKLAGILCESVAGLLVVGAGVNVAHDSFPPELAHAVSLRMLGSSVARAEVAIAVLAALEAAMHEPWDRIRAAWKARCPALGTRVRVGDVTGTVADLDDDGALVLAVRGRHVRVTVGDVERS